MTTWLAVTMSNPMTTGSVLHVSERFYSPSHPASIAVGDLFDIERSNSFVAQATVIKVSAGACQIQIGDHVADLKLLPPGHPGASGYVVNRIPVTHWQIV